MSWYRNLLSSWASRSYETNISLLREKCEREETVPDYLRGAIWKAICKSEEKISARFVSLGLYDKAKVTKSELESTINRDICRTFPTHLLFNDSLSQRGQVELRNVLISFSVVNTNIGYCQGMGFITAILLYYLDEEDTFWVLCSLMEDHDMADMFKNLQRVPIFMFQLDALLLKNTPSLHGHLYKEGVQVAMYASQWFITLYSSSFSSSSAARILDLFFLHGWKVIFNIAIAIHMLHEEEILKLKFEDVLLFFQKITAQPSFNVEKVLSLSLDIKTTNNDLLLLSRKYSTDSS